ncbi:MAG: FKBP-type peptidyl-prolyl cis-trans isomerase [Gemmataceae bacterium]
MFGKFITIVILCSLPTILTAQQQPAKKSNTKNTFKTAKQKVSYTLGHNLGKKLNADGLELDYELLVQGLKDAAAKKQSPLTDEEMTMAFQKWQQEARKRVAAKNKKAGEAFLAANKKKKGVVTLDSGLQYKILKAGTGKSPKATDTVKTHYHGTLIDGTVFDSSVKRQMPATFPVNGVIKGWTEALQKMKVGAKWKLFVPADLAYGETPRPGGPIGPNATLIFEVELLAIVEDDK